MTNEIELKIGGLYLFESCNNLFTLCIVKEIRPGEVLNAIDAAWMMLEQWRPVKELPMRILIGQCNMVLKFIIANELQNRKIAELKKFAAHRPDCDWLGNHSGQVPCNCGLGKLME